MEISDDDIKKFILRNAIEHSGRAQAKSVLGKVLGDYPDLRSHVLELRSKIEMIVEDVNRLSREQQQEELHRLGGLDFVRKVEEKKELPKLEIGREKFTVRFAPNPDGALHLGNARPAILSHEYAKMYKGRFVLRFDDTDPKIKIPEKRFYKWIEEDLRWLKIRWSSKIICSKRLSVYYKYAEKLIRLGGAYVCTCEPEKWKKMRDSGKLCPCRLKDVKTNVMRWKKMLKANTRSRTAYKEGEAVLRVKTDIEAKNPAVRDWPAMRIVDNPTHPISNRRVWPLYNFASAIEDYLSKVTHIFRGQEHSTNEVKQKFLYNHFKWDYPFVITLGRFSMSDMVLSKSRIRDGIENGDFTGWDDPRVGTLRTFRRRGFQPEALREIIKDIGPKPSDITLSLENLEAYNRKIVDKTANRYFFIPNPIKIRVKNIPLRKVGIPLHPEHKEKKLREFSLSNTFYVDAEDFKKYHGQEVRLKDLCNIKLGEESVFEGFGLKAIPKIQWLPAGYLPVRVMKPGGLIKGYGELNLKKAKAGDVVQFERFGFVRIEKTGQSIVAIFAHK